MKTLSMIRHFILLSGFLTAVLPLSAAPPVVKPVRWVAGNPLIPHDTYPGKSIRLKAVCDSQGANFQYTWDFGDGTPVVSGTVSNRYAIEASHTYVAPADTIFTAKITVKNTTTGETTTEPYYVEMRNKTLQVESNVAIDEGLWYLHKTQTRSGLDGYWSASYYAITAFNLNAFEANGHVESGDPDNPYVETANRAMRWLFQRLVSRVIPTGDDSNGNTIGIYVNQSPTSYQGGIFMDAIIASGTPDALVAIGTTNVFGRKYKEVIQDMCDDYKYAQYDGSYSTFGVLGGWRYGANEWPDNSACQWAAIGLIPAERNPLWACVIPTSLKANNINWLRYSQRTDGAYGYTDVNPLSGVRFGTTPSGMVQCALDGIGRGNALWDKSETLMRDNWGVGGNYSTDPLLNWYGLFAFVKAMRLHDSNGDGVSEPLQFLQSSTPGKPPIDWYAAQTAAYGGTDPVNGVARTVVNNQSSTGSWPSIGGGWFDSYGEQTARGILMLGSTLFEAGGPVAKAAATPNPAVAGQMVALDGTGSFHQDASRNIVSFAWDLDNNGTFEVSGPFANVSFPAVGNYPVTLRVTDNSVPAKTDDDQLFIVVDTPPLAPTANAGGPYVFCQGGPKWFLDGTGSINPDQGQSEPGKPGDTISYAWDLDGDGQFDDATGPTPDVTAFFAGLAAGSYVIQLQVTDTTATSFPSSGLGNLSDTDSSVIRIKESTDCACVSNLAARAKPGKVQLTWTHHVGVDHYNVYRSTISGGPYLKIGSTTSTYSTYLDSPVVNGFTYYYVVREANSLDQELCQSNQASAKPVATR